MPALVFGSSRGGLTLLQGYIERVDCERLGDLPAINPHLFQQTRNNRRRTPLNNDLLEFLGDRVVNLATAIIAHNHRLDKEHHEITRRILSTNNILGRIAYRYGLHQMFIYDEVDAKAIQNWTPSLVTHPPKALADSFEAYVGAVYTDHGWDSCMAWLKNLFEPMVKHCTEDYLIRPQFHLLSFHFRADDARFADPALLRVFLRQLDFYQRRFSSHKDELLAALPDDVSFVFDYRGELATRSANRTEVGVHLVQFWICQIFLSRWPSYFQASRLSAHLITTVTKLITSDEVLGYLGDTLSLSSLFHRPERDLYESSHRADAHLAQALHASIGWFHWRDPAAAGDWGLSFMHLVVGLAHGLCYRDLIRARPWSASAFGASWNRPMDAPEAWWLSRQSKTVLSLKRRTDDALTDAPAKRQRVSDMPLVKDQLSESTSSARRPSAGRPLVQLQPPVPPPLVVQTPAPPPLGIQPSAAIPLVKVQPPASPLLVVQPSVAPPPLPSTPPPTWQKRSAREAGLDSPPPAKRIRVKPDQKPKSSFKENCGSTHYSGDLESSDHTRRLPLSTIQNSSRRGRLRGKELSSMIMRARQQRKRHLEAMAKLDLKSNLNSSTSSTILTSIDLDQKPSVCHQQSSDSTSPRPLSSDSDSDLTSALVASMSRLDLNNAADLGVLSQTTVSTSLERKPADKIPTPADFDAVLLAMESLTICIPPLPHLTPGDSPSCPIVIAADEVEVSTFAERAQPQAPAYRSSRSPLLLPKPVGPDLSDTDDCLGGPSRPIEIIDDDLDDHPEDAKSVGVKPKLDELDDGLAAGGPWRPTESVDHCLDESTEYGTKANPIRIDDRDENTPSSCASSPEPSSCATTPEPRMCIVTLPIKHALPPRLNRLASATMERQ
ncbi:hypothetical protein HGRIS_012346 [Hohenbuehelia grisea]|uniref:RNase III domain-containing protein n=1 Tax=Hohenbuehelia grisea TaxID=104357 RepID=A0ABR3IS21_9AGAR